MTPTLDEMEARAQRHLDGMTVNRDAMARDVITLTRAIRTAQARHTQQRTTQRPIGGLRDAFDDLFDSILGGKL